MLAMSMIRRIIHDGSYEIARVVGSSPSPAAIALGIHPDRSSVYLSSDMTLVSSSPVYAVRMYVRAQGSTASVQIRNVRVVAVMEYKNSKSFSTL